jgi:hypothetical protein
MAAFRRKAGSCPDVPFKEKEMNSGLRRNGKLMRQANA